MDRSEVSKIWLTDTAVWIESNDGRRGYELFEKYPSLANATPMQREEYAVSNFGIHWPEIDEDLCFDGFFTQNT